MNKMIVAVEKRKQEAKYNKIIVTNEDEIMLCLIELGLPKNPEHHSSQRSCSHLAFLFFSLFQSVSRI